VHYAEDGNVFDAAARLGRGFDEILDFSANVTPSPLPDAVREVMARGADALGRYPDREARELRARVAERFGVEPDNVLVGNGATEFIFAIPRRLRPRRVVLLAPCYHDYWRATEHAGGETEGVLAAETDEFIPDLTQMELRLGGANMVFIGNPNNPTGTAIPAESIRVLAGKFSAIVFVVDEAYALFVPEAGGASMLTRPLPENVIVLRSWSSFYAVPGLRLGFMVSRAGLCDQVQRVREPWAVSTTAQLVGTALLDCERQDTAIRQHVIAERERLRDEISRIPGLRVFHSQANFLLVKITRPSLLATALCERMLQQKILIRNASGFRGLDGKFVRISVRTVAENNRFLESIKAAMDEARWK
jgi:L-threonine-O-3-phosphate decarboxylase